jgi:hypothetical protein
LKNITLENHLFDFQRNSWMANLGGRIFTLFRRQGHSGILAGRPDEFFNIGQNAAQPFFPKLTEP